MAKLSYLGHGSFKLESSFGTCVYIDPFAGNDYNTLADAVFITHNHPDHTCIEKVITKANCSILGPKEFQPKPGDYKKIQFKDLHIEAVEAYNQNHPKDECVGFVVTIDNILIYFSGDTSTTEHMKSGYLKSKNIDYAIFCGDGFYNMDIQEASNCATLVGAKYSIPAHLVPVHDVNNAQIFSMEVAEQFFASGRIIIQPGEVLELK